MAQASQATSSPASAPTLPTVTIHFQQQTDQPAEVAADKEAKDNDNDDDGNDYNGDGSNGNNDDNNEDDDNDDNDKDDNDSNDSNNSDDDSDVEEEAEVEEEAAAAESDKVRMLVDEELEVSAFILVSSGKHLMFERILRATGSQRLPRVLLPPQESGRVRLQDWVALP